MVVSAVTITGCSQGCGSGSASPETAVHDLIEAVYARQPESTTCRYVDGGTPAKAVALIESIRPDIDRAGGTQALAIAVHLQIGEGWEVSISTPEKSFGIVRVFLAPDRESYVVSSAPEFESPSTP